MLLPGLGWLLLFFALPLVYMAFESLKTGTIDTGFQLTWEFSNYTNALKDYNEQFIRSFEYAGLATLIALLIGYPLAYVIAFRGGKWRNALLLMVIVPFFVTYLIRTLSWETILSDSGVVVSTLKTLGIVSQDGRLLDTTVSVVAGITYNFLPFMILPLYASLERIDPRLLEAGYDLYGRRRDVFLRVTLPLSMPGVVAGVLLTFIPAAGDFINAQLLGHAQAVHDRKRHPVALPGAGGLPDRRGALVPLDGVLADHRDRLGAHRRNRGAAREPRRSGHDGGAPQARSRLAPERVRGAWR